MFDKPINVLIVDDHPVVRHGLRNLLNPHMDIQIVAEAEDGAQVIPLLTEKQVDLILLDIKMRGQNGIEIARRVHASFPEVKIIILTTYDDESYLNQALEAGVDGFLLKSVSHEILPDSIRSVMQGAKLLSPPLVSTVMSNYQKLAHEHALREAGLDSQDLEILAAIAQGASNKELAEQFFWSQATVKRRVQEITEKLNAANRVQAAAEAIRRGWI
jgi:two-component system response regulator DevR